MSILELVGLIATVLVLISYTYSNLHRLRNVNIIGSALFVIYGLFIHAPSVWILNASCIVVHLYKLHRRKKLQPGCIIIGYQGIGKSTLAAFDEKYIDLESGSFWIADKRDSNWYQIYCKIAIDLAVQGYRVFTSSHLPVREYLTSVPIPDKIVVYTCYPSTSLKHNWILKLKDRYYATKLDKDYKAYMNAVDRFDANIDEMKRCNAVPIELTKMNYNLNEEIERVIYSRK